MRFLKGVLRKLKGVFRKLEVSHGKKLGLGTFFFNSDSHFSERSPGETNKKYLISYSLSSCSRCPVTPNISFLKKWILRKLQVSQIKIFGLGNWDWKKVIVSSHINENLHSCEATSL